jgi:sigma-E factor negative regulatory protein RseC
MCDGCSQQGSCNVSTFEPGRDTVATVRNPLGARTGDTVEITIGDSVLMRGSVILYILPLGFMLAGIMLALEFKDRIGLDWSDDVLGLLAALAGLAVSIPVVRFWSSRSRYLAANTPVITEILERVGHADLR